MEIITDHKEDVSIISVNGELDAISSKDLAEVFNNELEKGYVNFVFDLENLEYSFSGRVGKSIEPLIAPMGFDWRLGIALVTGLTAKEVVVSTMGTIYALGNTDENSPSLRTRLRDDKNYNPAVAIALLIFVLLYVPCISATVVFHKELKKLKWTLTYIFFTLGMAWLMGFMFYNISSLIL